MATHLGHLAPRISCLPSSNAVVPLQDLVRGSLALTGVTAVQEEHLYPDVRAVEVLDDGLDQLGNVDCRGVPGGLRILDVREWNL